MKTPFKLRKLVKQYDESFEEKKERIEKEMEDQKNTDRNDLFNRIKSSIDNLSLAWRVLWRPPVSQGSSSTSSCPTFSPPS